MSLNNEKDEACKILEGLIQECAENQQEIDQNSNQTLRSIFKKKKEFKSLIASQIIDRLISNSIEDSQKQILSNLSKNIYEGEDQQLKQQFNSLFVQQVENIIISNNRESTLVKDLLQIVKSQADSELFSIEQNDSQLFTQIQERLRSKGIIAQKEEQEDAFQNNFFDQNKPFTFDDQQFEDINVEEKEQKNEQNKDELNTNKDLLDFDANVQLNENSTQKNNNDQNFNWEQFQFGDINAFGQQERQEQNKQSQTNNDFDMDWFKNNESVHSQISQKQSVKSKQMASNKQSEEKQEFNLSDFIQNSVASHSQSSNSKKQDFSLTDLGLQKKSSDLKDSGIMGLVGVQNVLNLSPFKDSQNVQETPKQSKQNLEQSLSNQKQSQDNSGQLSNKFKDLNQNQKQDEFKINLIKSDNQLTVGTVSNHLEDNHSSSFGKGDFVLKFGMNESQLRKNVVQQNANIKDEEIDQNLLNPKNISENYLLQGYKQAQLDLRLTNMLGSVQKCESENSRSGSHFQDSQTQQSLQNFEFFLKFDQNQSKNILSEEGLPNMADRKVSNKQDSVKQNSSGKLEQNEVQEKKENVDLTEKVNLDMWDEMESYKSEEGSKHSLEDSFIPQAIAAVKSKQNQSLNKSNLNLSQASLKSQLSKKSDLQNSQNVINKSQDLIQKTNELLKRSKKYQDLPLREVQYPQGIQSLNQQNQYDQKQNSATKQEQNISLSQNVYFDQSCMSNNNYNFEDFGMNQSQMSENSSKSSVVIPRNEELNFHSNISQNVKEANTNFILGKAQDQQKSQQGLSKLSSISNKKNTDSLSQKSEQLRQKTQEIIERANTLKKSQNISDENINQNLKQQSQNNSQQKSMYKEDSQTQKIKDLLERSQRSIQKTNENFVKQSFSSNAISNKSKPQANQVKMTSSQLSQNQKDKSLNFEDFGNFNLSQSQNDSQVMSGYIKQQVQGKESEIQQRNNFLDNDSIIKQKQISSKIQNSNQNNFDFDEFGSVHDSESSQSKSSIINVIHANTIKNLQNKISNTHNDVQSEVSRTISVGIQYSDDKKASQQLNFSDFQSIEQSGVSNLTQFQDHQNQQQSQINPNNTSNSQIFPQTLSQIFNQNAKITKQDINQQFNQFQNMDQSLSDNEKDVNYLSNLSQFTKNSDANHEEDFKNSERRELTNLAELAQSVSSSRSKVQYVQHKIIEDYYNEDQSQLDTLQEQPLKEDNELSNQFYVINQQKNNFQDFFGNQEEENDPDSQFIDVHKVNDEQLNTPNKAQNKNNFHNSDFQQPQYQNENKQIFVDQKSSSFQQFGQDFNSDNQSINSHNFNNQVFQGFQDASAQLKSEQSSKNFIQQNQAKQNFVKTFNQNASETQDFNFQLNEQSEQKNQAHVFDFHDNQLSQKEIQNLPLKTSENIQSYSNFHISTGGGIQSGQEKPFQNYIAEDEELQQQNFHQNDFVNKNEIQKQFVKFEESPNYSQKQQQSFNEESKDNNKLNSDQIVSIGESNFNQRSSAQENTQNNQAQNQEEEEENQKQKQNNIDEMIDQQQQNQEQNIQDQNVNNNQNPQYLNNQKQEQEQFLQQKQQPNQNEKEEINQQQNQNATNNSQLQQLQNNFTNNFDQYQSDYRVQEYKLMNSQMQNSNLCSEDSQDQFSSFQQANYVKQVKPNQSEYIDQEQHDEISDEQKDSKIYEHDKEMILNQEDFIQVKGQDNYQQENEVQYQNQQNNYDNQNELNEQEQYEEANQSQKLGDQSNNLNTFFLNQKQQALYTFDNSQYQQGQKRLDLYSKEEIMYFQDQQSQLESQTQNQQNQITQEFELRKKRQFYDSYDSDSQYEDQDENLVGQQILFSDEIKQTVLETVQEKKEPDIDLYSEEGKDFSNQNLYNPKAKNINQDDEVSFGEEQDEEYEQKLKEQLKNQPEQMEDQQMNQQDNQEQQQLEQSNQNEQLSSFINDQRLFQNYAPNDQQNNLQEFQGQHDQYFAQLEDQEKNQNLVDEEEGIHQILENSRGQEIDQHNRNEDDLGIIKNPDLQYELNSQIFQESVINPDGNEVFKSTNKQILELFPSIQHNIQKGLHSHQNSNTSIPFIKNSVYQAELSMINESLDQKQKNQQNQMDQIQEQQHSDLFSPEIEKNPNNLNDIQGQELNQHKDLQETQGWNFDQQQQIQSNNNTQQQNAMNNQNQQQNEYEYYLKSQFGFLEQGFIETGIETNTKTNLNSNQLKVQNISQQQNQENFVYQDSQSQNQRQSEQFNQNQKQEDESNVINSEEQLDLFDFNKQGINEKDQANKIQDQLFSSQIVENQISQELKFDSAEKEIFQVHQIVDQISPQQQENQQEQLNWDDFANKTGSSLGSQIQNSFEIFQQGAQNNTVLKNENKGNVDDILGFVNQKKSIQNLEQNDSQVHQEKANTNNQKNNKDDEKNQNNNFNFFNFNNKFTNNSDFYDNSNKKSQNNSLVVSVQKNEDLNSSKQKDNLQQNSSDYQMDFMTNPVMMNYEINQNKSLSFDTQKPAQNEANQHDGNTQEQNKKNNLDQLFDMNIPLNLNEQNIEESFDMNKPIQLNTKKQNKKDNLDIIPAISDTKQNQVEDIFDMTKPTSLNTKKSKDESFDMTKPVSLYTNKNKLEESFDMNKPTNLFKKQEKVEESFDMNKPLQLHSNKNDKKEDDGGLFNMEMPRMMHKKSFLHENKNPVDVNKEIDFLLKDIFLPSKTRSNITPSYNKLDTIKVKSREVDSIIDSPARTIKPTDLAIQQVNPNDVVDMEAPAIFMYNTKKSTQSGNSGGRNTTHNNLGQGLGGGLSAITPIEGDSDGEQYNVELGSFNSLAKIQIPAKKQYEINDPLQLTHQSLASLNLDVGVALSEKIDSPNQIKKFDLQMEKEFSNCSINSLTNLDHSKSSQFQSASLKKNKSHNDICILSGNTFMKQNQQKIQPLNLKNNLSSAKKQTSQTHIQVKSDSATNQLKNKDSSNSNEQLPQNEQKIESKNDANEQITEEINQIQYDNGLSINQETSTQNPQQNITMYKFKNQSNEINQINIIQEQASQEHIPSLKNVQEDKKQNKQPSVNLGQIFGFSVQKSKSKINQNAAESQTIQIPQTASQNISFETFTNENVLQQPGQTTNNDLSPKKQEDFIKKEQNLVNSPGKQSSQSSDSFYTVKDKLEQSYQDAFNYSQQQDKNETIDKKQEESFYSASNEIVNNEYQIKVKFQSNLENENQFQQQEQISQQDQAITQKEQNDDQNQDQFMIETDELDKELEYFNQDLKAEEEQRKEKEESERSLNKIRPFALNPNGKMSVQIASGNSSFVQQNDTKSIKSGGSNHLGNISIKNIPKIITYDQLGLQNNQPSSTKNKQNSEKSQSNDNQILADLNDDIMNYQSQSQDYQQDQDQIIKSNQNQFNKQQGNKDKQDSNESCQDDQDYLHPRGSSQNIQTQTSCSNTRNIISSKFIFDDNQPNVPQDFSGNLNNFLSTRLYPNNGNAINIGDQGYVLKINFKQKLEEKPTHLKKISETQELNYQVQSQRESNTGSENNCSISFREINFEKNPFESDFENQSIDNKIRESGQSSKVKKEQIEIIQEQIKKESKSNQQLEEKEEKSQSLQQVQTTTPKLEKKQSQSRKSYKFDFEDFQNPSLVATSSNASPLQKFHQQNNFIEDSMNRNILESEFTMNQSHLSEIPCNDQQKNGENLEFNNLSPISVNKIILKPELFQDNVQQNINTSRSFASQRGSRLPSPPSASLYNQFTKNKSSYYQQKQVQIDVQQQANPSLNKQPSQNSNKSNQENVQVQQQPVSNFIDEDDMWANMRNESSISQNDSDDSYMSDIIQKNIIDQQKVLSNQEVQSEQDQVKAPVQVQIEEEVSTRNKQNSVASTQQQQQPVNTNDFLTDMVNFWNNQNKAYNLNQSIEHQSSSRHNQVNTTNPQIISNAISQKNTQIQPDFRKDALENDKALRDNTMYSKNKNSLDMNQLVEKQSESQVFDFQHTQTVSIQPSNMQDFTFEQRMISQNQQKNSNSEKFTAELCITNDFPINEQQNQQNPPNLQRNQDVQYNLILKGNIQDSILDEAQQLKNQSSYNNQNNSNNVNQNSNNQLAEKTRLSEIPTTRTITDSSKNKMSSYIPQNYKSTNEIKKEGLNPKQVQSIYQPTQNFNFGAFNQDSQLVNQQQQISCLKEATPTKSYMEMSNQYPQYPLRIEISNHPDDPKFFENTEKEKDTTKENPTSRTPSTSPKQVFKLATSFLHVPSPQTSFVLNKVKDLSESPNQPLYKNNNFIQPDSGVKKVKNKQNKDEIKMQTIQEGIMDLDSLPDFSENAQNIPKDKIKSIQEVDEYLERSPQKALIEEKNDKPKIKLQKTQDFESKLDNLEQLNKQEQQKNKKLQEEFSQIYQEMQKLAEMQLKEADISKQEDFEQKQLSQQIQSLNRQLQLLTQNHAALLNRVESENIKTIKATKINQIQEENKTSNKPNSEEKLQKIQKEFHQDDDKFENLVKKFKQQKQEISQFREEITKSSFEQGVKEQKGNSQLDQSKQETETSKNFNNVMEKQSQFSNTLQKILHDIQSLNNINKKEEVVENQLQKKIKDIQEQVLKNNEKLGEINKYYNEIKTQVSTEGRSISPQMKVDKLNTSVKKSQSPKTIQEIYDNYQSNFKNVNSLNNLNSHQNLSQSILQQTTPFNRSPIRDAQLNAKKQKYLQEYESISSSHQKIRSLSKEKEQFNLDQNYFLNENKDAHKINNQFNLNALQQAKQYLHESASNNNSKNSLLNKLSPSSIRLSSPSNNLATKITQQSPPTQDMQRLNNFSQNREHNTSMFDRSLQSELQKTQHFANQVPIQSSSSTKKPPIIKPIPKPQQDKLAQKQTNFQNMSTQKSNDFYQQYLNQNNLPQQQPQPQADRQRSFSSSQTAYNLNQPAQLFNNLNQFNHQQMQSMHNLKQQQSPMLFSPQVKENTQIFDQTVPKFIPSSQENQNFYQKFEQFKQNNLPVSQMQNNNIPQIAPPFQNNNFRFIDNNIQQLPIQQHPNQFFINSANPQLKSINNLQQIFLSNEKLPTFSQPQVKQYQFEQQFDKKFATFQNEVQPFEEKLDSYGNVFRQNQLSAQKQKTQSNLFDYQNSFNNMNIMKQKNSNIYTPNKEQTVLLRNQQYKESNFNYSINQYRKNFVSNYYAEND